jgi:hypothetical protein
MGEDYHSNNKNDSNNALRIQTENLPLSSTPTRIPSTRSLNDSSYTSSPILTPSGSSINIPSSALTPLPSPLVLAGQFPTLPLDNLVLGTGPRRKAYGLGVTANLTERRNITEFIPTNGLDKFERSASSSAITIPEEGLRREVVNGNRSRQSSLGDEIYVYSSISN